MVAMQPCGGCSWEEAVDRNKQEREFLPAALEIVETPALPMARFILLFICFATTLALLWAFIGKLDVHASLEGRIVPSGKIKVIEPLGQSSMGHAVVRSIYVKEGEEVKAGDLLVELNPTEGEANLMQAINEHKVAQVVVMRFRTMVTVGKDNVSFDGLERIEGVSEDIYELHENHLRGEMEVHRAQLVSIGADISKLEIDRERLVNTTATRNKVVETLEIELRRKQKLNKKGYTSDQEVLLAKRALFSEQTLLVAEQGQIASVGASIDKMYSSRKEVIANFIQKALAGLTEADRALSSLEQEVIKAKEREKRSRLRAPVAGTVRQLSVHTKGDVVSPGEKLMVIVPKGVKLEVEAMMENKDKGFVVKGQSARIKVAAFPYTRYGTIDGKVEDVSNDAIDVQGKGLMFPVRASLSREYMLVKDKQRLLTSGMTVTVEVHTGERRVIEYLLEPLLCYKDEAMRER